MHLFYAYWMPYILRVVEFNTTHDAPPTELRLNYSTEKIIKNGLFIVSLSVFIILKKKQIFILIKDQNKNKHNTAIFSVAIM